MTESVISETRRAPASEVSVAVVIPVKNGGAYLRRVIPPLLSGGECRIVVVDGGSNDDTGEVARSLGAEVIRNETSMGPAGARNLGVERIESDVVLFVDADCVPHPGLVDRVRETFEEDSELVSVTGSYDSLPWAQGFFSQYMNLRHHVVHQQAKQEGATFWTGCGAVRRDAFLEAGGFDVVRFPTPQIEDLELGMRLRKMGKTKLDPKMQVTHLKNWTLRSVVQTDIRDRGLPWTKLILDSGEMPNDLNLKASQRFAAALSPMVLVGLMALPWILWTQTWWALGVVAVVVTAATWINFSLLRDFARIRGLAFATGAGLFHQVVLSYSATTFALGTLSFLLDRKAASELDGDRLDRAMQLAFAKYDPVALGGAVGTVLSSGLFLATAFLLVRDGAGAGPNLSLLGHYLIGFETSWPGALIGAAEALALGFAFGWALAQAINAVIGLHELSFRRQVMALQQKEAP
ncbi:MAG: glycosyltransferase family A protein [Acidobacteriota bacterium]